MPNRLDVAGDVAPLSVLGAEAQGDLLAAAANHDRRMGSLNRRRVVHDAVEAVILPGEVRRPLRPHLDNNLDRLFQPLHPHADFLEVTPAQSFILALVPASANAQNRAPVTDEVE